MKRVANRLVVLTIEPTELGNFWLTEVYFPEIVALDRGRCPSTAEIEHHLGDCRVDPIAIPHDCSDGFLGAFWRRPEASLNPKVRAGMYGFTLLDPDMVARGMRSSSPISKRVRGSGASATSDRSTRSMSATDSWSPSVQRDSFADQCLERGLVDLVGPRGSRWHAWRCLRGSS